ncbi:MAG: 30S ribosomal protein S1 [Gammaproteobacteria bacterium]|nr:30S ribosomal protein S1 [Gammaproteobacteria bacterium]
MSENFAQLFEESLANIELKAGTIVKASVIRIDKDYVIVSAGLKSEGTIPRYQFENGQGELEVNIGDEVDVVLEMVEDGYGETRLSREKAKRAESWRRLEQVQESSEKVLGRIIGQVRGGFTVDLCGLKAFLPGSLVDIHPVNEPDELENKEMEFKIIKMDDKRNNIVVSHRAVLEEAISQERSVLIERFHEGDKVKGKVKNLTDYGAFIDLGGIDGLLHITDMSWKRIKHPSELVEAGKELEVVVLSIDHEKCRISLGMKQLAGDPWQNIEARYPVAMCVKGEVTSITDYGCFVELEEGIEGLVHTSEMDWTNKNVQPGKVVSLGESVEAVVLEADSGRRRISLSIKQCLDNPWQNFAQNHKKGEKIRGKIRSITDFGIFVGLDGGIDGLLHSFDLSWDTSEREKIMRNYRKGEEIEVVILAIEADRERISLGIKQLQQDPFSDYVQENKKDSVVEGKIVSAGSKGMKVELAKGVQGYIRSNELGSKPVGGQSFNVSDQVEARIIGIDNKRREVQLSIKAIEKGSARALKEIQKSAESAGKATLGDLMKAKQDDKEAAPATEKASEPAKQDDSDNKS